MWSPSTSTISMARLRDGFDRVSFAQAPVEPGPSSATTHRPELLTPPRVQTSASRGLSKSTPLPVVLSDGEPDARGYACSSRGGAVSRGLLATQRCTAGVDTEATGPEVRVHPS